MRRVAGIDIGLTGAIAVLDGEEALVFDMPVQGGKGHKAYDAETLAWLLGKLRPELAVLEDVHAMPKQGVASTFTTGYGLGLVVGVLSALGIGYRLVSAKAWKRDLGLGREKRKSLELARELFPSLAKCLERERDHNRAEALLIAHWYLRQQAGLSCAAACEASSS